LHGFYLEAAAMALTFDPIHAVYDANQELVMFMAMDGAVLIRCAVSRDALLDRVRNRGVQAKELLEAYRSKAEAVHRVAQHKYAVREVGADGVVVVFSGDLNHQEQS
jgi:hypothetical protein